LKVLLAEVLGGQKVRLFTITGGVTLNSASA